MSKISEFFGLNCKDESLDFEAAMNTQICPYTQRVCTKMRKSDPDIKIGTCSVQYQHQDVIICPYRLLEHNQIFIDCLHFENIGSEENLLSLCQNRSVFSVDELKEFWRKHRYNLKILKFIFVKSLSKRLTLGYLWEHNIIAAPGGPRPFTPITDEQFDMIVKDSETEITYVE